MCPDCFSDHRVVGRDTWATTAAKSKLIREERQKLEDEENRGRRQRRQLELSGDSGEEHLHCASSGSASSAISVFSEDIEAAGEGSSGSPSASPDNCNNAAAAAPPSFLDRMGGACLARRGQNDADTVSRRLRAVRRRHMQMERTREIDPVQDDHRLRSSLPSRVDARSTHSDGVSIEQDRERKTCRLRSLMPRSFLSVFGQENLEWSDDETDGKTTSSKATKKARKKEARAEKRCLLVTHAKELNVLKRMGFTDRQRNKAVLRWTWGDLNKAVEFLEQKKPGRSQKKLPPMRRRRPEIKEKNNSEVVGETHKIVKTG